MPKSSPGDITRLLFHIEDRESARKLFALTYDELHTMAARMFRRERAPQSIGPSDLVNEAYLRLLPLRNVRGKKRAYFFGAVKQAMQRVLIDHRRARCATKRGGGLPPLALENVNVAGRAAPDFVDIREALDRLRSFDPRMALVVELHGLAEKSVAETAKALGIAPATVRRDWFLAKMWLRREMEGRDDGRALAGD